MQIISLHNTPECRDVLREYGEVGEVQELFPPNGCESSSLCVIVMHVGLNTRLLFALLPLFANGLLYHPRLLAPTRSAPFTINGVLDEEERDDLELSKRMDDDALELARRELVETKRLTNEVVGQPGRGSRFGRGWRTLAKDVDWATTIGERIVDACDDVISRSSQPSGVRGERRRRVVVLGSGWGANAVLKQMQNAEVELSLVSPRNFFLFTPMLAGTAVGTLEPRSIIEPIRESLPSGAEYFEAEATGIDSVRRVVTCESVECEGDACELASFELPYDTLVVSVGAGTNTFGVKGVREHCVFLKQLSDAQRFRTQLGRAFERASLPGLSDAERVKTLTFVVIGAGPTGVELCGELRDFVSQDGPRLYPTLLRFVKIVLLEASDKVLLAFDTDLQQAALDRLTSTDGGLASVDVRVSAGVEEVTENEIRLSDGASLPYGIAVWAAGIGTLDFVRRTAESVGAQAEHAAVAKGRLAVDPWLRVHGARDVFAFGDCAHCTVDPLPATAQVASQAGTYVGRLIADGYRMEEALPVLAPGARFSLRGALSRSAPPFRFLNLGILAYVGGSEALVQVAVGGGDERKVKSAGKAGFALWRSVYLSKQYGLKNRLLVAIDWVKARAVGRDISRLS